MSHHYPNKGYLYAILAAVFFGASTPASKVLLYQISPWLLAGLLYLGSAIGLFIIFLVQVISKNEKFREAPFDYKDWGWLAAAVFLGGILGPIFLMVGLIRTPASVSSLLLNLESVLTALFAWFIFKEHTDPRVAFGMLLIVVASMILSWKGSFALAEFLGPLLITAACLCWAIDNNLTRKISAANPLQIALTKSFVAGAINTTLAFLWGAKLPSFLLLFVAGMTGFIGYGLSLLLFIFALRYIGTARTGAYFSIAPFLGAGLAIIFLGESVTSQLFIATLLMAVGIWLHLSEYHSHEHQHEELEHQHRHVHDGHHKHTHSKDDPPGEPHTHWHKHEPIIHSHPHYPDIHHRHKH